MGALRMGGVEPCEIRFLPSGEPGCDVTLFGRQNCYTVRMEPRKQRTSLYALPLDSKLSGPGGELHVHEWTGTDYVGGTLACILGHEGIRLMSWQDAEDWRLRQDF